MITTASLLTAALTYTLISSMGPVKLACNLIVLSIMMMYILSTNTGSAWFPLIFLLLFTGGILMMFMILSSFLPNEKSTKMKIMSAPIMMLMVVMLAVNGSPLVTQETINVNKWIIETNTTFAMITVLILMYFVSFMEIVYTDKLPMRSSTCQQPAIL